MKGLLLLNLGTPKKPETPEVRAYLKEFLMDPWVIDIPGPLRWLLVHGLILPKRPAKSAAAYRKIWTERGSPLLVHLEDLTAKVAHQLGPDWSVLAAMRYGEPSIRSGFEQLRDSGVSEITVLPLYPQYSLAATESSIRESRKISAELCPGIPLHFVDPFYDDPLFIQSFIERAHEGLKGYLFDHVLFSFHGLPEHQVKRPDVKQTQCLVKVECCNEETEVRRTCYRAQCLDTAKQIANGMGLQDSQYTVCFQSRLGRRPWLKPFTDELLRTLPARGIRRLAVLCPSFVSDCLETLEEIEIRGKQDYLENGGEDLKLVSSLNSSDSWVNAVAQMARARR